jgi:hypothetical protein
MLCDWGAKPVLITTTLGVMRDLVVPVCQACNAWMNKRFETRIMLLLRSLLAGTEQVITPEQQLQLTLWFTKTIMMYDIVADPGLVTRNPQYIEFRRTGRPIPRSRLWLGHCGDVWPIEQLVDPPRNYLLPYGASVVSYRPVPCSSSCSRSGVPRISPRSTTGGFAPTPADPPLPRAHDLAG